MKLWSGPSAELSAPLQMREGCFTRNMKDRNSRILSDYFRFLTLSSDDIIPTQKFTDGVTDKFDKTLLPLKWVSGITKNHAWALYSNLNTFMHEQDSIACKGSTTDTDKVSAPQEHCTPSSHSPIFMAKIPIWPAHWYIEELLTLLPLVVGTTGAGSR